MNVCQKGKRGEREAAAAINAALGTDCRRGAQYCGNPEAPDVTGWPGVHVECKRTERLQLHSAMAQAVADAGSNVPVVVSRRSRDGWLVTVRLADLARLAATVARLTPQEASGATITPEPNTDTHPPTTRTQEPAP